MNTVRRWLNLHAKVLTPVAAGLSYDAARWAANGSFDRVNVAATVLTGVFGLLGYAAPDAKVFATPPTERLIPADQEIAKG